MLIACIAIPTSTSCMPYPNPSQYSATNVYVDERRICSTKKKHYLHPACKNLGSVILVG